MRLRSLPLSMVNGHYGKLCEGRGATRRIDALKRIMRNENRNTRILYIWNSSDQIYTTASFLVLLWTNTLYIFYRSLVSVS